MTARAGLTQALRTIAGDAVPGVALAIVGPEGVRETAAVGSADLARGAPASPQMVSPWFSMTKIVTATTAMRMAERELLYLDAPVMPLVPVVRRLEPAAQAARITPRHLLTHSAGLSNPVPLRWIHPADGPGPDPDAFLDRVLTAHRKLRFEPGSKSSYSNLGTLLLGSAMARATGTPLVDLVREEVLDPLRMSETGFAYTPGMEPGAATGYHPRRNPVWLLLPRWVLGPTVGPWRSLHRFLPDGAAYGGLVGSVEDAARFLQMHLRDGELGRRRILTKESARAMREITMRGRRFDLGLGWFRPADQRGADPPFVEHLGAGAGFLNVMRIYPTEGVGVVVMGNATKYDVDAVARLAIRA